MNKDEALNKFTFMMEYRNLSSNTIHMYRWYLSRMFDFYQLEDVSILDVSMAQNYVVHKMRFWLLVHPDQRYQSPSWDHRKQF